MSDPQPVPGRRTPPRADPLQPDKPGPDLARESDDPATDRADEKQRRQSEDALKNVTTGYD